MKNRWKCQLTDYQVLRILYLHDFAQELLAGMSGEYSMPSSLEDSHPQLRQKVTQTSTNLCISPMDVLERFIRYVRIDTQSKHDVETVPSTSKQLELSSLLSDELSELGVELLQDEDMISHGIVCARLPANNEGRTKVPVVGFLAHIDTSPDAPGANVSPRVIKHLGGPLGHIPECDETNRFVGEEIVVSDGTTLLGADDKAGVAAIMSALTLLMNEKKNIKHGEVVVGFTTDEEVGQGVDHFNVKSFGADVAFTVDGGEIGELEDENFYAFSCVVEVVGKSYHPGYAKGKMKSAIRVASEFVRRLPMKHSPEETEGMEGFIHPIEMTGTVGQATVKLILRSFSMDEMRKFQENVKEICEECEKLFPGCSLNPSFKESYRNMNEVLKNHKEVVEIAEEAYRRSGVEPRRVPIRGGTDGTRLCFEGLPTPNIFAGGINFHSVNEFVPVSSMKKSVEVIINIIRLYNEKYLSK